MVLDFNKLKTSALPELNGKLIQAEKLTIFDVFLHLYTNFVYYIRKKLGLEMTKSCLFFKKLSSGNTENGWGSYCKWRDVKYIV